jgi:cell division septation protein DedD
MAAGMVIALAMLASGCDPRQSDWESARNADTAQAYAEFLKRYPQGDFVSQARARLEELKLDEDWKSALAEDTAQGYQHFIEFHPVGAHADEARIRIENLNLAAAPAGLPAAAATHELPAPVLPAPAVSAAASSPGQFRVQLGAFSSASRARSAWQKASAANRAQLGGLAYTIERTVVGNSTLYRLQTVGIAESRARAICGALKARNQPCVVVVP